MPRWESDDDYAAFDDDEAFVDEEDESSVDVVRCSNCGTSFAELADRCPNCGEFVASGPAHSRFVRVVAWILLIAGGLWLLRLLGRL